jgi:hypothetical protein
LTLSSADGVSSPGLGANIYTNNTTVTASGTAAANFIPFWKTMQTQWGYGITGSTNYLATNVTSGTTWSHSETGVTGHRRLHFFGVSASGRTSGQASGQGSGWTYDNSGHANYFDVYVDNAAPVAPSLLSVSAASTSQINLGWSIPNDNGVGIAAGSTEAADATSPYASGNNYYRRGDVGVQVYRGGSAVVSAWSGSTVSASNTGLTANTAYTYTIEARDNTGQSRGAWSNTTGQVGSTTRYTWAKDPTYAASGDVTISCDKGQSIGGLAPSSNVTFSFNNSLATGGSANVGKLGYLWNTTPGNPSSWTGEQFWTSGATKPLALGASGSYYLHIRSYNNDSTMVTSGNSLNEGPYTVDSTPPTVQSVTSSLSDGTYKAGQVVPIQVTFSEPVIYTVGTGVGQLQLETGATDEYAPYVSGSGAATLTFNYTVASGDTTSDLEYLSTSALTLTGTATIQDAATNNATLTLPTLQTANSLGGSKAIAIDTTPPTIGIGAASASLTKGGPITYVVTYSGESSISLASGNVSLNATGNATASGKAISAGVDGDHKVVTLSGITGDGTLGISIAAGTASDPVGNTAAAAGPSGTFSVDNSGPTTPTLSVNPTASANQDVVATFGGASDAHGPVTYKIKLDVGGTYATDTSPKTFTSASLTDGSHTVYVKAIDSLGNESAEATAGFTMTHDNTPPTGLTLSLSPQSTNTTNVQATFSASDPSTPVTYKMKLDSGGYATATSPDTISVSGLSEGVHTVYVKASDSYSNETDPVSATFRVDTTNPTADVTLTPESHGVVNYLKGKITVDVTPADTGGSGIQKVEMKVDSGSYSEITPSEGVYTDDSTTITSAWANGAHSITVKVTDNAGNYIEVERDFNVNRNEVSGLIALQDFTLGSVSRTATFVLTYTQSGTDYKITKTVTPSFIMGRSNYSFTDIPDGIKAISAKTAWSLRKKLTITPDNGQATVDFTGTLELPGGDLPTSGFPNGDNVVNALDYAVLRNAWGHFSGGDITGDGWTDNADYVTMKENWYKRGDLE